jgi:Lon protease-like protein
MRRDALYSTVDDLPPRLPVFPLPGAVLLPGGDLPLNIFEPRYLKMLSDALATDRLIGMVQPRGVADETDLSLADQSAPPELYSVGCAGRITSFNEVETGQVQIVLSGICRFRIIQELDTSLPYRMVQPSFEEFTVDLDKDELAEGDEDRKGLLESLGRFLDAQSMHADWNEIEAASTPTLINTLVMIGSFSASEKQAVLEASDLRERTRTLKALTDMSVGVFSDSVDSGSLQ